MKHLIVLTMACALAGCMADVLMTTAVQGELQAKQLQAAKGQLDRAKGMSAETQITQAIKLFQAEKGRYPLSLEALVPEYLPQIPSKPDGTAYGYDASTGQLLDSPPQGTLTQDDWAALDAARAAVQQYGADTTWYPRTLADLVPKYLPALPTTQDGRAFIYDNQTGEVFPPGQAPATRAAAPAPNFSAGAEMVTGIGIQQELNNMGQSGVNSAGSNARRNVTNVGAGSDRQMKAVEELGL